MTVLRSLLYAAVFYPVTVLWVLVGIVISLFGERATHAVDEEIRLVRAHAAVARVRDVEAVIADRLRLEKADLGLA